MRTWAYVLVRTDMPLPDQGVQIGHARMEAARRFEYDDGTHLVVLGVPHRQALDDALFDLQWRGVRCHAFYEPDDDLGLTAACTERIDASRRRCFRRYALWRAVHPRGDTGSNIRDGPLEPRQGYSEACQV